MYYGIVMIAVLMFGLQFFYNQKYQQECGSSTSAAMFFMFGNSIIGLLILLAINRFQME